MKTPEDKIEYLQDKIVDYQSRINDLRQELSEKSQQINVLSAQPKWLSVEDFNPADFNPYLLLTVKGEQHQGHLKKYDNDLANAEWSIAGLGYDFDYVTHFTKLLPLPEKP